jgi:hypothetical protein
MQIKGVLILRKYTLPSTEYGREGKTRERKWGERTKNKVHRANF